MEMVADKIFDNLSDSPFYHVILEDLKNRKIDPFAAAEQLTDRLHYGVSV
jgi:heat shock protein HspQ